MIGVYGAKQVPMVAAALARLGVRQAFVVHGAGMDEFTNTGPTIVGHVIEGEAQFGTVTPDAFGLSLTAPESLAGGDAAANAAILRSVFEGEAGPRRDVVVMNAAAVLVAADLAAGFLEGAALAQQAIDSGKVSQLVQALSARLSPSS